MKRSLLYKVFCVILVLFILVTPTLAIVQEAHAMIPAVLALNELAPGILAAMFTLIAAGVLAHNDDGLISLAKKYYEYPGKQLAIISAGVVTIAASAYNTAKSWLSNNLSSLVDGTETYSQNIGNTLTGEWNPEAIDVPVTNLIKNVEIGNTGVHYFNLVGTDGYPWTGFAGYIDAGKSPSIRVSGSDWPGYYTLMFFADHLYIEWDGGGSGWGINYYDISGVRLRVIKDINVVTGALGLFLSWQVMDAYTGEWQDVSNGLDVAGNTISLHYNGRSTTDVCVDYDLPLVTSPSDVSYNPTTATNDYSFPVPTAWDQIIDKSIDDIANPPDTPPADLTVLDYLKNLWDWLTRFWDWITGIPGQLIDAIKTAASDIIETFTGDVALDTTPLRVAAYTLTNKFPFSLPWDLYRALNVLNVESSFDPLKVSFYNPIDKSQIDFIIDPKPFTDVLAPITRAGFLIIYGVGLVFVTRKIMGGGV